MNNYASYRYLLILFAVSLIFFSGCGRTQPSRFYLLYPLPDPAAEQSTRAASHELAIGIGPVIFPDYLDRPQMVTRSEANQIKIAQFSRWAEPLKQNVSRVLAENLSLLLATDHVAIHPWSGTTELEYQVAVNVIRFDGELGDHATFIARWTVYDKEGKNLVAPRKSSYREPLAEKTYEALVAAQSKMLADFSREIASTITSLLIE